MMSMRGLRLGINRKRRRNEDDLMTRKSEGGNSQGKKRRTSFGLTKCSTELGKGYEALCLAKDKYDIVQIGERVNLSDILFAKDTDFLITYNDRHHPVRAKHLEGKVIVLYFLPLVSFSRSTTRVKQSISTLVDIYNTLHRDNVGFEVVFIGVKLAKYASKPKVLLKRYEQWFSSMPWLAIPFSDIRPPPPLLRPDGFCEKAIYSVVIDPTGVVLQNCADYSFFNYGAEACPFSNQRIDFLQSQDREALDHPSITKLLTSPQRDYLINNQNQVVPLHTLEDKVVLLYFYYHEPDITEKLKSAYEQFAKAENSEIVLVYIPNTYDYEYCQRADEDSFWLQFREMPWLALPFKDSKWITLKRIFNLPMDDDDDDDDDLFDGPDPRLVIVGPQGKFIERYGADILLYYGISAYPFTRQRAAQVEVESIQKLSMKMFFDPNTSLIQENGSEVKLPQLVGKKIIVIFKGNYDDKFLLQLRARYFQLKGTDAEFDVIYICRKQGDLYSNHVGLAESWLRHLPDCRGSNQFYLLLTYLNRGIGLLAFDGGGRVVKVTKFPTIERGNMDFPFDAGGLERDALSRLETQ